MRFIYTLLIIFTVLPQAKALSNSNSVCSQSLTSFKLSQKDELQFCRMKKRTRRNRVGKTQYCSMTQASEVQDCRPLNDFEHASLKLFWNEHSNLGYNYEKIKVLEVFLSLERPLYFGGSVTAESLNNPAWRKVYSFVTRNTGISHVPSGKNPAKLAVQLVYEAYAKLNSGWKASESAHNYIGETIAPKFKTTVNNMGSRQVLAMLDDNVGPSSTRRLYQKSTAIIGLDGFYWDPAIKFNSCGYGEARYDLATSPKTRTDVEWVIESLVKATQKDGKLLLLATTPLDSVETSKVDNYDLGIKGYSNIGMGGYESAEKIPYNQVWRPGVSDCVESINETIRTHCGASSSCKYLDFNELNTLLWEKEYDLLPSQFSGKDFYDFRPDGVHLSEWGANKLSEIIFEQIMDTGSEEK